MRVRQFLAASVIAAVALFGTAGIAAAQTTNPTTPGPQSARSCDKAKDRVAKLEARRVHSEQIIDRLHKEIAAAQQKGRNDLVQRLQARLDKVQKRHDHIVDLINKVHARCG